KINDNENLLSQFADDIAIILDGKETSLRETLNILDLFYKMSGLKANLDKTKAVWIGSKKYSKEKLCKDLKLIWEQGNFKILGITFTTVLEDITDFNFREKINSAKTLMGMWTWRQLTIIGRIYVIKFLVLPKFIQLLLSLPNPNNHVFNEIESMFFKFI
ncbi:hypothetical protein LOTGIDRAFT_122569, partial [Lottia gigantea]